MARKKPKDDVVIYGGAAWGQRLGSEFPQGVVATLQPHEQASPEMLARARDLVPERKLDEFDVRWTSPHKVVFVDRETGAEYRRCEAAILVDPQPHDVECFVVDHANTLHLLRPRGPRPPAKSVPLITGVVSRRIS